MSLSASLNNALTGLGLASRRAEIISSNVANADTPGYARRRLATNGPVTGVSANDISVRREVDANLQKLRRDAAADAGSAQVAAGFHTSLDTAIGDPDQAGSLQDLLSRFDTTLTAAIADPTSNVRLAAISNAAEGLADKLNSLGSQITRDRRAAETQIAKTVQQLNEDLAQVSDFNASIARMEATGRDASNLKDQRQVAVDRIAAAVPVTELPRENGRVALVSTGGVILLDGSPAQIEFSERPLVEPDVEYPTGLSGLTFRGRDLGTGRDGDGLAGGSLGALFDLRDNVAVEAMARLDTVAFELASRFQNTAVDPTLAAGQPGLFTDNGAAASATTPAGLASRLRVNSAVGPDQPSGHWKLRDGLGATTAGPVSASSQLQRLAGALRDSATPARQTLTATPTDLRGLTASFQSAVSLDRVSSEASYERFAVERDALVDLRDGAPVDVDSEMRRLLEVEQSYAANARLVQAVSQMMDRLTEI
ncbi:flagellar hook protein FlgK [Jannaschia pagri]|uniref:Flagellar hook-associated protein 1 n=1 Tax=Jannaschia pagri TaxID=2829797 RepID=A0ABQ4NQX1_9RHOB|nr:MULTISPECIES: flagellar hook-associated protein FlgK [unclassified Jannaschia]GIT92982.1 flagellar hook protein FlgK [Jannaschia sp. AI_61]GIT96817.1 flagellar hook protein FlgK [Jannaschia sp. AI_62]